jgi:hypothetical protein
VSERARILGQWGPSGPWYWKTAIGCLKPQQQQQTDPTAVGTVTGSGLGPTDTIGLVIMQAAAAVTDMAALKVKLPSVGISGKTPPPAGPSPRRKRAVTLLSEV